MKRIIKYALIAAAALSMQSCLFEQKDLFEESSSVRLDKLMESAKATLIGSQDGWLLEMYPEGSQRYGGYAFIMKFDADQQVTVYSEIASKFNVPATSLYKLSSEDGACLTFDTYNEYIHFFSTPNSSRYQAYEGEFEFIVCDVKSDLITLRGTKTLNTMYMRKFSGDPVAYLESVAAEEEAILVSGFKGNVGGKEIVGDIDIDNRQVTVTSGDQTYETAYAIVPGGIRFYEPAADINAISIDIDGNIAITDGASVGTALQAVYPEGYRKYNEFNGKYEFTFWYSATASGAFPCRLTAVGDGTTYRMTGVAGWDAAGNYDEEKDVYDVILTYSKSKGNLSMLLQNLTKNGEPVLYPEKTGRYVGITPLQATKDGATSGYLSFEANAGVMTVWNGDETNPEYVLKNNGSVAGRNFDAFWVCTYSGPTQTSATRSSGSSLPVNYKFFGKTHLVWKPSLLKKIGD